MKHLTKEQRDMLAEKAIEKACEYIQQEIGQDDGGTASMFFTGKTYSDTLDTFTEYIDEEMKETENSWEALTRKQLHEDFLCTSADTISTLIIAFEALLKNRIDGTFIDIADDWTEERLEFYIEVFEELWSDKHESELMRRHGV